MSHLQPTSISVELCKNYEYVMYGMSYLLNLNFSSVLLFRHVVSLMFGGGGGGGTYM